MKCRNGFVSNSSSSSFCIYGACLDDSEIREKLKALDKFKDIDDEDDIDVGEVLDELFEGTAMEINSSDGDYFYIGSSWSSIKDDETGAQFKENVREKISKVLGKVKLNTHEEILYF